MLLFHGSMDSRIKETLIDYIHNTGVRTDIFMRGTAPKRADIDQLDGLIFGITSLLNEMIPPKIDTPSGKSIGSGEPIPKAILDGLTQRSMTFQEITSLPALAQKSSSEVRDSLTLMAGANIIQPIINQHRPSPMGDSSQWQPSLALTRILLASDFPLTQPLHIPSAHTGQCASLPPVIALILSTLQDGANEEQLTKIVVERLLLAQSKILSPTTRRPSKEELTKSIMQQLPLITGKVIPRLVAMGVYG
jgi:hypothetical protein